MFGWLTQLFGNGGGNAKRYSSDDLRKMNKIQLEQHARKFGVELDRRENKEKLIKETIKAQAKGIKKKL
jgi:DNA-binding protein H-NS